MTVANNQSRDQYTATSGQTVFPYTFEIFDKDDVVVLKNGAALVEGTNYTVSNVGNDNGGNITLTTGASTGEIITIYRDMPLERTTDYQTSGDFLAAEVNNDFDRLWLASQQLDNDVSRAIRKPESDLESLDMELPPAITRANSYLTFGNNGQIDLRSILDPSVTAGPVVYVDDYGTVGDGVTDDTAAIKAALAAAMFLQPVPGGAERPWQGNAKIQFGINKRYKISETLDIQGALAFLDDPDGQPNYYGCNVDVDFGGSIFYPTITANPVVIMWGQSAVYSNLRIDPREYCTDQQIFENKLVGVRLCPMEFDELAGFAATYNSTYDRIIIDRSWRGFEMPEDRNFFYRCKFQFCESTSFDYGFYIDCNAYVGDGTSNAFQQCHVRAGDAKNGRSVAGVDYWCIQTHTSSAATQPGVGADWEDYWVEVDWSTGGGTYPAWATSTFYTGAGKGYYLRGGAIFAFTGHNSVDGCIPHRNNVGPALTVDSPAAVIISGGLHLEAHYLAKDYVPLIDLHGADVNIDQIYLVACAFEAPTASVVIGSSPNPIVYHNSVYYQVKANHLASADKEPGIGASWATYWDVVGTTPEYAGDWALGNVYRIVLEARNVTLNNVNRRQFAGYPFDNYIQVNMDRMGGVELGLGYVSQYLMGEPTTYSYILRDIVAIRQFEEVQSATANYTFVPNRSDSGTHFRYNVAAPYAITMDVSAGPDIQDGAYFELSCVSSVDAYTGQAGFSRITGSATGNVQGPTEAKNGQTLCIQKQSSIYLTWIKPTSGYRSVDIGGFPAGINSCYTQKLDEYVVAEVPPVSRWQGHMIMVTDETGGYVPAFCDGTNWRRVTDRAIIS